MQLGVREQTSGHAAEQPLAQAAVVECDKRAGARVLGDRGSALVRSHAHPRSTMSAWLTFRELPNRGHCSSRIARILPANESSRQFEPSRSRAKRALHSQDSPRIADLKFGTKLSMSFGATDGRVGPYRLGKGGETRREFFPLRTGDSRGELSSITHAFDLLSLLFGRLTPLPTSCSALKLRPLFAI